MADGIFDGFVHLRKCLLKAVRLEDGVLPKRMASQHQWQRAMYGCKCQIILSKVSNAATAQATYPTADKAPAQAKHNQHQQQRCQSPGVLWGPGHSWSVAVAQTGVGCEESRESMTGGAAGAPSQRCLAGRTAPALWYPLCGQRKGAAPRPDLDNMHESRGTFPHLLFGWLLGCDGVAARVFAPLTQGMCLKSGSSAS